MMDNLFFYLICWWASCCALIFFVRHRLLKATWQEPYFGHVLFVIESDDWGPGNDDHIHGLKQLLTVLGRHRDITGKTAVLTANIILTVPDKEKMITHNFQQYAYKTLPDHFENMLMFMQKMHKTGLFFPQLHGLAHYHPEKITALAAAGNATVRDWISSTPYEWEKLPHPLQAHYINGTVLPSRPVDHETQKKSVDTAGLLFKKAFGFTSQSTVAPCYLWDDTTEKIWADAGFRYVQTAGYRCTGLDAQGNYLQNPAVIRPGERNTAGLRYLVRTVMFEPTDFSDAEKNCIRQIKQSVNQGLAVVMSTHRYNYAGTGSCLMPSVEALDRILTFAEKKYKHLQYLHSEELGAAMDKNRHYVISLFLKLRMFLFRLWYRHQKIRYVSMATLLILPGLALILISRLFETGRR